MNTEPAIDMRGVAIQEGDEVAYIGRQGELSVGRAGGVSTTYLGHFVDIEGRPENAHEVVVISPAADAISDVAAEIERRAIEVASRRFEFMGLGPSDLIDAIYFAKAHGWQSPASRSRSDSDED